MCWYAPSICHASWARHWLVVTTACPIIDLPTQASVIYLQRQFAPIFIYFPPLSVCNGKCHWLISIEISIKRQNYHKSLIGSMCNGSFFAIRSSKYRQSRSAHYSPVHMGPCRHGAISLDSERLWTPIDQAGAGFLSTSAFPFSRWSLLRSPSFHIVVAY